MIKNYFNFSRILNPVTYLSDIDKFTIVLSFIKIKNMTNTIYKNCQSCGMPLNKDVQGGGTEKDGSKSQKYCSLCYSNGQFNGGDISLQEFSEASRKGMIASGKSKFFAWIFSRPFMLGHLERWKSKK